MVLIGVSLNEIDGEALGLRVVAVWFCLSAVDLFWWSGILFTGGFIYMVICLRSD